MVNIAILGAGFMGKTHSLAYQKMEDVKLVAICDINDKIGKALADSSNCEYYADCENMLKAVHIDVIDICLPTFFHEKYTLLAAKYRKHVFCEKPATLDRDALKRMIDTIEKAGTQFMVGQVIRFWPEYVHAKKMYNKSEFGTIKEVYASRLSVHPEWSEWYRKAENSGGALFDLHLHDIDILCYIFGKVKKVYAVGKKNEYDCWNHISTILSFENGVNAVVEGIIEMPNNYPFTMSLRITGDEKALDYRMIAGSNLGDVSQAIRETRIYAMDNNIEILPVNGQDPYETELRYFVDCIKNNVPANKILPKDVAYVLKVIHAIKKSLEIEDAILIDSM